MTRRRALTPCRQIQAKYARTLAGAVAAIMGRVPGHAARVRLRPTPASLSPDRPLGERRRMLPDREPALPDRRCSIVLSSILAPADRWRPGRFHHGYEVGIAMHTTTQENLRTALRGEAFAGAKYLCFAAQARLNGRADVAALFERTAVAEHREHFSEEAALVGLVGSDAGQPARCDRWRGLVDVDVMYTRFTDAAAAVGDAAAAARFAEIRRDEQGHLAAFQESLRRREEEGAARPAARAAPPRRAAGV